MTACVAIVVACLVGCGRSQQETAATSKSLNEKIPQLEQGASVDVVKEQLGEPEADAIDGVREALSYGVWQLSFVNDRLEMRSKVVVPRKRPSRAGDHDVNMKIVRLPLGTTRGKAEARLGAPEVVYVIYEGESEPIRILRYGQWELTFTHGALSFRSH